MNGLPFKPRNRGYPRLVSFLLFLTVFFLPFHFHALTVASQVSKECSCLSGTKTQSGLAILPAGSIPVFEYQAVIPPVQVWPDPRIGSIRHIRAPPAQASL